MPEEKQTLLSGVKSLTFLYYDGTQWDHVWDTTQQTNLPYAISHSVEIATPRLIDIPCSAEPDRKTLVTVVLHEGLSCHHSDCATPIEITRNGSASID